MNNNTTLVLGIIVVAMLVVGGIGYTNLNNQITESKQKVQQLQEKLGDKEKEINDKDEQIKQLQASQSETEKEVSRRLSEVRDLQNKVTVVGTCLKGVVDLMDAATNENPARVIAALSILAEPCNQSEAILQEVEKFPTNNSSL